MTQVSLDMGRKNVLVIGCGNLGRWHIKGLETAAGDIFVDVVDSSQRARHELKNFLRKGVIDQGRIKLNIWQDLETCSRYSKQSYDLVIVATLAYGRLHVVEKICSAFDFTNLLIEKPIEQSEDAINKIVLQLSGRSAYVNHTRRMSPWYQKISNVLVKEPQITCKVTFPSLGLACNASHWIDLMNWWTKTFPISIDTSELKSQWKQTKRSGFWDIEGVVKILFENDNLLVLDSHEDCAASYSIEVASQGAHFCTIDEPNGTATFNDGCTVDGLVLPQSQLTGILLNDLVTKNACDLPSVGVAAQCNLLFTAEFFSHFKRNMACFQPDQLPIT